MEFLIVLAAIGIILLTAPLILAAVGSLFRALIGLLGGLFGLAALLFVGLVVSVVGLEFLKLILPFLAPVLLFFGVVFVGRELFSMHREDRAAAINKHLETANSGNNTTQDRELDLVENFQDRAPDKFNLVESSKPKDSRENISEDAQKKVTPDGAYVFDDIRLSKVSKPDSNEAFHSFNHKKVSAKETLSRLIIDGLNSSNFDKQKWITDEGGKIDYLEENFEPSDLPFSERYEFEKTNALSERLDAIFTDVNELLCYFARRLREVEQETERFLLDEAKQGKDFPLLMNFCSPFAIEESEGWEGLHSLQLFSLSLDEFVQMYFESSEQFQRYRANWSKQGIEIDIIPARVGFIKVSFNKIIDS